MVTCRFGVRRQPDGGSDACFDVFDRMTGATVASGMRRAEAEADARHRNQDTSGPPAELAALQATIDAYVTRIGLCSRALVAQAAQALEELRTQLADADRLVGEQQARIADLYKLFTGEDGDRR